MILFRRALVHLRLENLFGLPERGDLLDLAPQPRRKAREKGRAKGGRLDHARAVYGLAEDIRLELHEEIADGGAAVHAQVRPTIVPRAYMSQCGAPRPVKAETR